MVRMGIKIVFLKKSKKCKQHKRDEGVRAQEQESVAGVVRCHHSSPQSGTGKSLKLNLAPHGPCLRVRRSRLSRLRRPASAAPEEL